MLADFFSGFVVGVAVLWLVQLSIAAIFRRQISKEIDQLEALIQEKNQSRYVYARVEKVDDYFYIYDNNNDEFLVQGRSFDEMDKLLRQRWPDRVILLSAGDKNVIEELKKTQ